MVAKKIYPISQATHCVNCGDFFFRVVFKYWQVRKLPFCCEACRKEHLKKSRHGSARITSNEYIQSITERRAENWGWQD